MVQVPQRADSQGPCLLARPISRPGWAACFLKVGVLQLEHTETVPVWAGPLVVTLGLWPLSLEALRAESHCKEGEL